MHLRVHEPLPNLVLLPPHTFHHLAIGIQHIFLFTGYLQRPVSFLGALIEVGMIRLHYDCCLDLW